MPSDYTTPSSRRPTRGGRRRPRRRNDEETTTTTPLRRTEPPVSQKLSLWERILAFFKGSKPPERPARARDSKPSAPAAPSSAAAAKSRPESGKPARSSIRKPETVEVTSPRIYVGNLSFDASESDLFELFSGIGIVQNVELVCNRQTQRSKGFAFVQMQTADEARHAVAELHDKDYMGRKLVVSGAKAQENRASQPNRSQQPEQ